jgi:hypothetical protein
MIDSIDRAQISKRPELDIGAVAAVLERELK